MRPDHLQATLGQALHALQRGDVVRAEALAAEVLREHPREATSLMIAGLAAHARGNAQAALEFLRRADEAAPRNPMILGNMGVVFRHLDRLDEARAAYEAALSADPKHFPTRANFARLLDQMGLLTESQAQYRAILAVKRDHGEALAGLAAVLEQKHALEEAQSAAEASLKAGPSAVASLTLARIAVRQKRPDAALAALADFRRHGPSPVNAALGDGLEGQALELRGDYPAAFAAFARANETLRALHAPAYEQARSIASGDLLAQMAGVAAGGAARGLVDPPADDQAFTHVFLVGFPRSGTTLMEQALAAHPGVQSLEEKDTLAGALGALVVAPSAEAFFAGLDASALSQHRAAYWAAVARHLGGPPRAPVFLDKMPIHSAYLALLFVLFPRARFVFAMRDPRDAVLSCFQQRFGMNAVMYRFLTLEGAAALYDGVLRAAQAARTHLPLTIHDIRYERLVADFEGEMRRLVAFLGLDWSPAILDYRRASRERYVSTPSAAQVLEPVSDRAVAKFRHYREAMAGVLPVLKPWAEVLGYPPE
jgi:tetratricopeptide (TPR) repeat protein